MLTNLEHCCLKIRSDESFKLSKKTCTPSIDVMQPHLHVHGTRGKYPLARSRIHSQMVMKWRAGGLSPQSHPDDKVESLATNSCLIASVCQPSCFSTVTQRESRFQSIESLGEKQLSILCNVSEGFVCCYYYVNRRYLVMF